MLLPGVTHMRWIAILLVVALGVAAAPIPQMPSNAPASTVRRDVRLVQINVVVHDKNGPVSDLTKDDFVVLDQGKPQKVSVFSVEATKAPLGPAQTLPQNTFSNQPQKGATTPNSVTVVLLDNLNTLYGSSPENYEMAPYWFEDLALANAKAHLIQFLQKLGPQDRVAIYGLRTSLHILCDFTSDRDRLLAIVKGYDTTALTNRNAVEPGEVYVPNADGSHFASAINAASLMAAAEANRGRIGITLAALRAIAGHVANIPGRKNLVWLSSNLPFSYTGVAPLLSAAQIAVYPVDGRGLLTKNLPGGLTGIVDGDAYARGDMMPAQSPEPMGLDTMQKLAEDTGGQAFFNTNDLTGAIRKAVEDAEVTYTLGFYIPPEALDGKLHRLKLEVKRPGVEVRYPRAYFATKAATEGDYRSTLSGAILNPIQSSAIGLEVRAQKATENALLLVGNVDLRNIQASQEKDFYRGAIDVHFVQQDAAGKVLRQTHHRLYLQLTDAQYSDDLKSGIYFRESVKPESGTTTLRVIVEDPATARIGSLIIPVSQIR